MNTTKPMGPTAERILQTGFAFWGAKVLLSAVEMELFTDLARYPGGLAEVSGRMGLHPRAARDFLELCRTLDLISLEAPLLEAALHELSHLAIGERSLLRDAPRELLPDHSKP